MEEVMKSNSRVESLMKKFSYYKYDSKTDKPTIVFQELLKNFNDNFYRKFFKVIDEINSFLEIITTL